MADLALIVEQARRARREFSCSPARATAVSVHCTRPSRRGSSPGAAPRGAPGSGQGSAGPGAGSPPLAAPALAPAAVREEGGVGGGNSRQLQLRAPELQLQPRACRRRRVQAPAKQTCPRGRL